MILERGRTIFVAPYHMFGRFQLDLYLSVKIYFDRRYMPKIITVRRTLKKQTSPSHPLIVSNIFSTLADFFTRTELFSCLANGR